MKNQHVLSGVISAAVALGAANATAQQTAAQINGTSTTTGVASGTTVTYGVSGNYPVITSIVEQPGTFNGKTYTSWTFLAQDSSGSMEIFGSASVLTTLGFTPAVGDAIQVSGTYSPFLSIAELGTLTSISLESAGNSVGSPITGTLSSLNSPTFSVGGSILPESLAGTLVQLDDVTISGQTAGETFGIANLTLTATDSTGSEALYYYPTSFSLANQNLFGQTIPTGPVDIVGIASDYNGTTPEFVPLSITAVPEPATLSLCGAGAALALFVGRRRKA